MSNQTTYQCMHAKKFGFCKFGSDCQDAKFACIHERIYGHCKLNICRSKLARTNPIPEEKPLKHMICTNPQKFGKCTNTNCRYSHSLKERNENCAPTFCKKYVLYGQCFNLSCKYQHPENVAEAIDFMKNQNCNEDQECLRGKDCWFLHSHEDVERYVKQGIESVRKSLPEGYTIQYFDFTAEDFINYFIHKRIEAQMEYDKHPYVQWVISNLQQRNWDLLPFESSLLQEFLASNNFNIKLSSRSSTPSIEESEEEPITETTMQSVYSSLSDVKDIEAC